jgi:hypothetical protein
MCLCLPTRVEMEKTTARRDGVRVVERKWVGVGGRGSSVSVATGSSGSWVERHRQKRILPTGLPVAVVVPPQMRIGWRDEERWEGDRRQGQRRESERWEREVDSGYYGGPEVVEVVDATPPGSPMDGARYVPAGRARMPEGVRW